MTYYDADGKEVSLRQLVIKEPDWAVSRITVLLAEVAAHAERRPGSKLEHVTGCMCRWCTP